MNNRVGIIRCENYDPEQVYQALRKAVDLAEGLDLQDKTVLLKPNILFDAPPEKALTTHPVFLQAAIRICQEQGAAEVFVGDSPGFQKPGFTGKISGLRQVTEACDAVWVDFTKDTFELECPGGRVSRQFTVGGIVRQADRIISLPKLKTHQLMYFTGALKNLFGLVPNLLKSPYHLRHPTRSGFASMIVDLASAVQAHYAFMDAIIGMEGPGPAGGYPRPVGLVLVSSNLLALDVVAGRIVGYPDKELPIHTEALSRRIWLENFSQIETLGEDPAELVIRNYKKIAIKNSGNQLFDFAGGKFLRPLRQALEPRPVFLKEKCIKCGDCIKICPASALEMQGRDRLRHIVIDYGVCIRCYCCHEICPVDAIDIKKKPFSRRIR
jgi:uncharacterized protein (DUF362 family)/Pyruvate/2-oxoacid:ferredoxin oxidoreductase delta subunit